ncbi:helix-turn-helix domain-containing protein, partial [Streptomyces violascens]|uniref:helix-turn-helix domain-containing protein n=1 Tax=Streptomyces violascens TaxID=67381 RepID=UPI0036533BB7
TRSVGDRPLGQGTESFQGLGQDGELFERVQGAGRPAPLLDTLTAYFDAGCNAAGAARRLRLSVRALTYRPERIHQLTGANPADPPHRYTLQTAVIGARFLEWPRREL